MIIFMIGFYNYGVSGSSLSFFQLFNRLKDNNYDVRLINASRYRSSSFFWDFILSILKAVSILMQLLYVRLLCRSSVHLSFQASSRGHLYFSPLLYWTSRILGFKFSLRIFGGNYVIDLKSTKLLKYFSIFSFVRDPSVIVYLQTYSQITLFKSLNHLCKVIHLPTSRTISCHKFNPSPYLDSFTSLLRIVYCGRVTRSKGVYTAIEGLGDLPNVTLDIWGSYVSLDEEKEYNMLASQYSNVVFRGVYPPNTSVEIIKNYDCLILPTSYPGEGYPGVVVEAYIAGRPVLVPNNSPLNEIVTNKTGLLLDTISSDSIKRSVELLFDRQTLRSLQENAWQARLQFDSNMCDQIFINPIINPENV